MKDKKEAFYRLLKDLFLWASICSNERIPLKEHFIWWKTVWFIIKYTLEKIFTHSYTLVFFWAKFKFIKYENSFSTKYPLRLYLNWYWNRDQWFVVSMIAVVTYYSTVNLIVKNGNYRRLTFIALVYKARSIFRVYQWTIVRICIRTFPFLLSSRFLLM